MNRLSVVIITRNEEVNLTRCLDSVRFAEEIVVVDSHSTDRTLDIAKQFNAKIYTIDWKGFGLAKQFALDRATGDWVLSLDADEVLSPGLADEISSIVQSEQPYAAYDMPRLNNFLGQWIRHCGWYPGRVLRLFRRSVGRFTPDIVHERVEVTVPVGHCKHDLHHYSHPTFDIYFEKLNRYTTAGAEKLAEQGEKARLFDLTIRPFIAFIKHYISRAGFLDGVEGLIISVVTSCAVFIKYAKLRQINKAGKR